MQKKLMLLGGIRYLLPVIEVAHQLGVYVITADYLPNNIAHKYSDEYVNVSIIDKEAVLRVAQEHQIDGIMSFGVDPGVITAAYVADKMELPSCGPYESVCILQNKDLFRAFLTENGFNVPWAEGYASVEEALSAKSKFHYPIMVKPTDSAGSKGVVRVDNEGDLEEALCYAQQYSHSGRIIVEEFIEKVGCSSDTDIFSIDGKLQFVSFSSQHFDHSAIGQFTPAAFSWPSTFTEYQECELQGEIQRLISLLHMGTSIYNVETCIGKNGKPYIMELSPRGGGNRLAEMLRYATGVDMVKASLCAALDLPIIGIEQKGYCDYWAEVILHTTEEGIFQNLEINPKLQGEVIETDLWVNSGEHISSFVGANDAIGTLVLKFKNQNIMEQTLSTLNQYIKILIK